MSVSLYQVFEEYIGWGLFSRLLSYSVKDWDGAQDYQCFLCLTVLLPYTQENRKLTAQFPSLPRAQNMIGVGFRTWQLIHMCKRGDIKIEQK